MTPEEINLKTKELAIKEAELKQKTDQAREDAKSKRSSIYADLLKFFIGTVVLGLVTNFMNDAIQQEKVDLEATKTESEHLSTFAAQYLNLTDLDQKKEFLEFMITISYSDITRSRYQNLLDTLQRQIARKSKLEAEIGKVADDVAPQEAERIQTLEKEIAQAQATPNVDPAVVAEKQQQLDKIINENASVKKLQELNQKIAALDNSYRAMRSLVTDTATVKAAPGYALVENLEDEWMKEDYYRMYADRYLAVNSLNNKSVTFQLRTEEKVNEGVIANFTMVPGQTKVIDAGNWRYEIVLLRIGAAGRFPLPKAAIYSCKVSKKS